MSDIMQLIECAENTTDIARRLMREARPPELFDLLAPTWPGGSFALRPGSLSDFLERPDIRMVRVSTVRMMCDLWELAMPHKAKALVDFCHEAPSLIAGQFNAMFPVEQREHVRIMLPELYAHLEGFDFGVLMSTVAYYDGDHTNWNQPSLAEQSPLAMPLAPHAHPIQAQL